MFDKPAFTLAMASSGVTSLGNGLVDGGKAVDRTTLDDFLVGKLLELTRFLEAGVILDVGGREVVLGGNENGLGLGTRVATLVRGCLRLRFGSSSLSSSLT